MQYVALLRGINVGGNKKVPMSELKSAFISAGFSDVLTLLNTGNVIFHSEGKSKDQLRTQIESLLEKSFGFSIPTIIVPISALMTLRDQQPFEKVTVTPNTRLYVTCTSEPARPSFPLPYRSPDGSFEIIAVNEWAILSVLTLSPTHSTTKAMDILEKEFGKNITTRNWNTMVKIAVHAA